MKIDVILMAPRDGRNVILDLKVKADQLPGIMEAAHALGFTRATLHWGLDA